MVQCKLVLNSRVINQRKKKLCYVLHVCIYCMQVIRWNLRFKKEIKYAHCPLVHGLVGHLLTKQHMPPCHTVPCHICQALISLQFVAQQLGHVHDPALHSV